MRTIALQCAEEIGLYLETHPMSLAAMLPGHGTDHRGWMERYAHLGAFSAMLHDRTEGSVRPRGDWQ